MSRRTDKKKFKRMLQAQPVQNISADPVSESSPAAPVSAVSDRENCPLFIQYQGNEYSAENIIRQIREKCGSEGMDPANLRVYVKPEDGKAYFACAGGNGFIAL